ncbi:cytochrome P450 [Saccharothrix tamanrassetensis]|uniref:Cytochrome P450 n=1 Tax=Saccharothrix tamanrassetensis TaxID=1051531 RepID=A0A841C9Q6_9PSEU|nr:cytochrome P450 [Saccharothrix tamanrassetensis]MBB5953673.1 cytochrome P450 [Saccharothrix tamanrassetensis]
MSAPHAVDFTRDEFLLDPWPVYAHLRATEPVHFSEPSGCYVVAAHADVRDGLARADLAADFPLRASRLMFGRNMLDTDGEAHRTLRRLVNPFFGASAVADHLREVIKPVVDSVVDALPEDEEVDLVSRVAVAVPYGVVCRLMGIPPDDAPWLYEQMRPIVRVLDYPKGDVEPAHKARQVVEDYFRALLADRDRLPAGSIIDRLRDPDTTRSAGIGEPELLGSIMLMLVAGTETSVSAISNIVHCLLGSPDVLARVWRDPDATTPAIQESLRWEPPLHSVLRFAATDLVVAGTSIGRRSPVLLSIASANRDERVFTAPERFRLGRGERGALTFGVGQHACPGMFLAEREFQTLLGALRERFAEPEVVGPLPRISGHIFRRAPRLPVRLRRR